MRRDASLGMSMDCLSDVTLISFEYCDVIKRVARFCMDSKSLERYDCEGFQIDDAYSSFGRTNVRYASFLMSEDADLRFRRRKPSVREASEQMDSMCVTHDKDDVRCTPRYLYILVLLTGVDFMLYRCSVVLCLRENDITLHFARLRGICASSHHEEMTSRSCCRVLISVVLWMGL